MKKTLATLATAFVMVASFSSFAAESPRPSKESKSTHMIDNYLASSTLGDITWNNALFAEDFEYRNLNNNDQFDKKAYMKFLKENKNKKYNCTTTYSILDENAQTCLAKATMVFENFTRVDYITLNNSEDGWKVSKVVTTYP
ncbi:nuclear transport factor 2 family protein [Sphingobacterium wenxiniae]|uniref:Putative lumazine-binding n=1 Tax=Sphingobacterium wenxiniae TaxID=683125 RepID=A0A1I6P5R2_9SPHI|nr:nuclear transport factor 2 family protein [Sphingobacterium wenxiniae]SFS35410.1 Putative lumazine-binding [Sphingobacterium wenxiniae]